ncbi:MAG: Flp pilus assembly protein CpaB [Actinobacteria bacterium]|nr:MAG: Flp pilus assembly protein CpaB [Actinomycetota bacterium]
MKTKLISIAVAVLLGVLAALSAATYLVGARKEIDSEMRPVEVLVARDDLTPGLSTYDMSERGLIEKVRIPKKYLATGAISSVSEAQGQVLSVPLVKGDQLTTSRFRYPSDAGLAYSTPKRLVAVTISADEVRGVAGFVKPGDKVVVVATFGKDVGPVDVTKILIPSATILAVDQRVGTEAEKTETSPNGNAVASAASPVVGSGGSTKPQLRSVTLSIAPKDIPRLVFAQEKGKINLALLAKNGKSVSAGKAHTIATVFK